MSNPRGLSDRILVLGDESKSARAIQRLLQAAGYDAVSIDSIEATRDELRAREVSLIVIESSASRLADSSYLPSPDDSGESLRRTHWAHLALAFCEEIRSQRATAELPVLVISKSHRPQDKVACLNQGATDYLTRPYQRAELLSRVRAHLRSSHYERERAARFEQLHVLHTVSSVLASSLEPEVLLTGTLSALISYARADAGVVYLREADERPMLVAAAEGLELDDSSHGRLLDLYSRSFPDEPKAAHPRAPSRFSAPGCNRLAQRGRGARMRAAFAEGQSARRDVPVLEARHAVSSSSDGTAVNGLQSIDGGSRKRSAICRNQKERRSTFIRLQSRQQPDDFARNG